MKTWLLAATDFGDTAVLMPLAALMLLWLLLGNLRSAAWWGASVGFCVGLTALLKIFFIGCPPAYDLRIEGGAQYPQIVKNAERVAPLRRSRPASATVSESEQHQRAFSKTCAQVPSRYEQ